MYRFKLFESISVILDILNQVLNNGASVEDALRLAETNSEELKTHMNMLYTLGEVLDTYYHLYQNIKSVFPEDLYEYENEDNT